MKIVIPGGTGQVGHILARHFHQKGDSVTILSRSPHAAPWRVIPWDGVTLGPWIEELDRCDVCINLAGRSVNCRYTPANRRSIFESRVRSTQILHQAIAAVQHPPSVWLNASTATIYRHALDRPMDEATGEFGGDERGAPDTWNFSIQVAKAWEEAFFSKPTPGTRKVALRSAMTLSPDHGGVFDVFLGLVRHGLGGTTLPATNTCHGFMRRTSSVLSNSSSSDRILPGPSTLPLPIRCRTAISCISFVRHGAHVSVSPPQGGCSKSAPFFCAQNPN